VTGSYSDMSKGVSSVLIWVSEIILNSFLRFVASVVRTGFGLLAIILILCFCGLPKLYIQQGLSGGAIQVQHALKLRMKTEIHRLGNSMSNTETTAIIRNLIAP
jgi:hypothetical protein